MSPIKRMTSAFSSAGDRSSRFPGGDMPLQNLKSHHAKTLDLPIFPQAVSPMPPYSCRQQNRRCPDFCPYYTLDDTSSIGARNLASYPELIFPVARRSAASFSLIISPQPLLCVW